MASLMLLLITLACFWWVFSLKDSLRKFFYLILAVFIYIYCGLGVGYATKSYLEYEVYYSVYVILLSLSLKIFCKRDIKMRISNNINLFSTSNSALIFLLYFGMTLIPMVSSGEIGLLLNPPSVDLTHITEANNFEKNTVSGVFDSLKNFVVPLVYLALYKYRGKPLIVILLLFAVYYIDYCQNAYIGRGTILAIILFVAVYLYYYFPRIRKGVVISALSSIPIIVIFFVSYLSLRMGLSVDNLSFNDSLQALVESESYYYSFYYDITGEATYLFNYIVWFITLPLPGFLKVFDINMNFNALFSALVNGVSLGDIESITLPGLVNESIFIFGKYLFFLHAILLAWVISVSYNSLKRNESNFFLIIHSMITLCMFLPRGGTSGPYSGAIKILFIFFLFYIFRPKKSTSIKQI